MKEIQERKNKKMEKMIDEGAKIAAQQQEEITDELVEETLK